MDAMDIDSGSPRGTKRKAAEEGDPAPRRIKVSVPHAIRPVSCAGYLTSHTNVPGAGYRRRQ